MSNEATKRRSGEGKKSSRFVATRGKASSHLRNEFELARLRAGIKPFRLHWFSRLRSTSNHAAEMRAAGHLFAPAIVLTGHQLAGRGRGTNTWWSGPGVLTVTFALPINESLSPHQIPLLAGLAVRDAVAAMVNGVDVRLKWPNDLLIEGRKLAGLLCERSYKVDLIGLGLNVNVKPTAPPPRLRGNVVSLSEVVRKPLDMTDVLITVTRSLHAMLTHQNERTFGQHLREYDRHHALIGRRVEVVTHADEPPVSGKCEGLDSMGRLLLRDRRTLHRVIAGQVRMR